MLPNHDDTVKSSDAKYTAELAALSETLAALAASEPNTTD